MSGHTSLWRKDGRWWRTNTSKSWLRATGTKKQWPRPQQTFHVETGWFVYPVSLCECSCDVFCFYAASCIPASPEPLRTSCTRVWWSTWTWTRRMTVRSLCTSTWSPSEYGRSLLPSRQTPWGDAFSGSFDQKIRRSWIFFWSLLKLKTTSCE